MSKYLTKRLAEVLSLDPKNIKLSYGIRTGIKSPIFCSVKSLQADVKIRKYIVDCLVGRITEYEKVPEAIAGTATGVVPFSAIVADRMQLPHYSVSQVTGKLSGTKSMVEGKIEDGTNILLIADVVTAGKGSVSAIKTLRGEGGIVDKCLTVVNYNTPSAESLFREINCELDHLTTIDDIIFEYLKTNQPTKNTVKHLENFVRKYLPHGEKIMDIISRFKIS